MTAEGYCTVDMRRGGITDWSAWGAEIVHRFSALELSALVGIAPNPDLAFLAARRAAPVLMVQSPATFLSHLAVLNGAFPRFIRKGESSLRFQRQLLLLHGFSSPG